MMKNQTKFTEKSIKIFDAFVAVSHNLVRGSIAEKIFFLHLFKCGGSSVAQAIQTCYLKPNLVGRSPIFRLNVKAAGTAFQEIHNSANSALARIEGKDLNRQLREYLVLYHMSQNHTRYIAGHFGFSELIYQSFADQYAFVTILRDPVERYISAYFYQRYRNRKLDLEIADYLPSQASKNAGSCYARNLSGFENIAEFSVEKAVAQAKENLHKFKLVGCLEYQSEFIDRFEAKFGRKLNLRVFNQSPKSVKKRQIIDESVRKKIIDICQPDLEIYQYAVDNLLKA
jgi:hypothetical protein